MRKFFHFIALFCLLPFLLSANSDAFFPDDADLTYCHNVNVLSGHLHLQFQDAIVQGAVSLPLTRTYTSAGALEKRNEYAGYMRNSGNWVIQGGWNLLPHLTLIIQGSAEKPIIYLSEKNGTLIMYKYEKTEREGNQTVRILKPEIKGGQCSGILSGRTNPRNQVIRFYIDDYYPPRVVLCLPDGGKRLYEFIGYPMYKKYRRSFLIGEGIFLYFGLRRETFPNGLTTFYSYDKHFQLVDIALRNPREDKIFSSLHFNVINPGKEKDRLHVHVTTSDAKEFHYRCANEKEINYLIAVQSNSRPQEQIDMIPGRKKTLARFHSLLLDGQREFKAHYFSPANHKESERWIHKKHYKPFYADKVRVIEAPLGKDGAMVAVAQFSYEPNRTEVRDVEKLLTRYHHDGDKLNEVEYFDERDQLSSLLTLHWNGSQLAGKTFLKNRTEALFSKTFHYDDAGNVIEEVFWGNLTGNASEAFAMDAGGALKNAESYTKRYGYLPEFNVPLWEEEEEGPTYKYFYKPKTSLLTAKLVCDKEKILQREFFSYDEDHLLVCEIVDDGITEQENDLIGVTQRRIKRYILHPQTGLIQSCSESCWDSSSAQEKQLRRTEYTYSSQKKVIAEAVYDATDVYRYTIHMEYDTAGRVTLKTTPVGGKNSYAYDTHGNLLECKEVGKAKKKYTYQPSGLPLSCEESGVDGQSKTSFTLYDAKGRLLSHTDTKGNTTNQTYDVFGRCRKTEFALVKDEEGNPYHPNIHFSYDPQGNLASTTSPREETTSTLYNSLRKPIYVTYPDGSWVKNVYNKNGTLAKTLYSDQSEIHYTYDVLQRMLSKRIFAPDGTFLAQEAWEYNAFHLLAHTDQNGRTTYFQYDGAGRKCAESSGERTQVFAYDALGFLEKTSDGNLTRVEIHDEAGRAIDQFTEDSSGTIENRMFFFYDEESRKCKAERVTSQGMAIDLFAYDAEGRLSRHENPLRDVFQFLYSEIRDDFGQTILQKNTIDPLGKQKIETFDALSHLIRVEKKDPQGKSVALEEFFYDLSGNKSKRVATIFQGTMPVAKRTIRWEYDSLGRVLREIESDQKVTTNSYDIRGRIATKTLPRGIILFYTYDGLGRLCTLSSSDGTIHYEYIYGQGQDPIQITDVLTGKALQRTYNSFGQILEERTAEGLVYRWDYDTYGRCIQFYLPDGSHIAYNYASSHLIRVQRFSAQETLLYEHCYTAFDVNGHVSEESLIQGWGAVHTAHDLLERPFSQSSTWMQHCVSYGPSGLVTSTQNSLLGEKKYTYDALNQLIQEADKHFALDSLGNPSDCTIGECNQILSTADSTFSYDLDGNPVLRISGETQTKYTYDALGRLTSIIKGDQAILFYYDPLSRLESKMTITSIKREKVLYLYDREAEIGTCTQKREIKELKVLGLGIKKDIGATVAIELKGVAYAPLHDLSGNIIALLSSKGVIEQYPSDAFGRETCEKAPINPWRFSSKRSEEDLVFFGKRFYDRALGRWLTPDPAGFADGPNLYLYVCNSPLNRLDLFGLRSEAAFPWPLERDGINIEVKIADIENLSSSKELISARGSIGGAKKDFFVSCGHWHRLQYTPEEKEKGSINIIDHLSELIPKDGALTGLITAQNGMLTKLFDLRDMSESILDKIPESTLFIAVHLRPSFILKDFFNVIKEKLGYDTPEVCATRQFMGAMIDSCHNVNPSLLWVHISHSRGGGVVHNLIQGMNPDQKHKLAKQLISYSYGSSEPILKELACRALNIYSEKDYITKRFGESYRNNSNYDIKIVKCLSSWQERNFYIADHKFLAPTSQEALGDFLEDVRSMHGFYDDPIR